MLRKYLPYVERVNGKWGAGMMPHDDVHRESFESITVRVNCCRKRHEITLTEGGQVILHNHMEDKAERDVFSALMNIGSDTHGSTTATRCEEVQEACFSFFDSYAPGKNGRNWGRSRSELLIGIPKAFHQSLISRALIRKGRTHGVSSDSDRHAYANFPLSTKKGQDRGGPTVLCIDTNSRKRRWCVWMDALQKELAHQCGTERTGGVRDTKQNVQIIKLGNAAHLARRGKQFPAHRQWFRSFWVPAKNGHRLFYTVVGVHDPNFEYCLPTRCEVISLNHWDEDKGGDGIVAVKESGPSSTTHVLRYATIRPAMVDVCDSTKEHPRFVNSYTDFPVMGLYPGKFRTVQGYRAELGPLV